MSAQAVGYNEILAIVPCHRVVGTNDSLTGRAGGIEKKLDNGRMELVCHGNVCRRSALLPDGVSRDAIWNIGG